MEFNVMSKELIEAVKVKASEDVLQTAKALEQLMGSLPECVNAPECTDNSPVG
jgi:hypothetical protein